MQRKGCSPSFIASQDNWRVAQVYSDAGFSGATTKRPALQQLLSDLKKEKIDIVFVYKIDRLTRSPKDFYQLIEFFEQSKIDFISITERFDTSTPAGRLLRNIMLTFSQFERELTSERTRDKLLERAKKGMCNGGFAPFGYARQNKKIIPDKKEAETIKSIFETYVESGCLAKTYRMLKEQGITNRLGKNFSKTNLGYILRNITYTGKIRFNNDIYQGQHTSLISEEIFAVAQKIHKNKMKKFRVYKNFLFGGLIKCERCGYHMTSVFTNKRPNGKLKRYYYYRCTSTMKQDWQTCSVKQVSAERLENFCLENLERISIDRNYIENLVFRLNHDMQKSLLTPQKSASRKPHGTGYELTKPCSNFPQFSEEKIANTLNFFITALKNKKGIERNLFTKRFLENIIYSPENITISFVLANPPSADAKALADRQAELLNESPALLQKGWATESMQAPEKSNPRENPKFVLENAAADLKCSQTFEIILPNLIHKSKKRPLR